MMVSEKCLRQITQIRNVAAGVEVAYVARSRVNRLIISLTEIIAKESGLKAPSKPGPIFPSTKASKFAQVLAQHCNKIFENSRSLCQPSEPLDERWRNGWSILIADLDKLEEELLSIS